MATIDWPSTLPPLDRNFSAQAGFNNNRLLMDSNRVRQYPQHTTGLERVTVRWKMNPEQLGIFKEFHSDTLGQGVEWFNIDIPNPDGQTFTNTEVRFLGGYKERHLSYDNWSLEAQIEYQEASILPPGSFTVTVNANGSIDWPEDLLGFPATFNVDYDPANATSSIDTARLNIRKRYTQHTELLRVKYEFDQEQYGIFRYTFQEYLTLGNDWFEMRLPYPNDINSFVDLRVRFASDYSARYVSLNHWDVQASIEYEIPQELYSIEYFGNTNDAGIAPGTQVKTKNIDITLSDKGSLAKIGNDFVSWNTSADGTGTDYAENALYSGNTSLSLYAKWLSNLPTWSKNNDVLEPYNTSLVAVHKFSDGAFLTDSKGDNDLFNIGPLAQNSAGKDGYCLECTGGFNDKLRKSSDLDDVTFGTGNLALSMWIKPDNVSNRAFFSMMDGSSGQRPLVIYINNAGRVAVLINQVATVNLIWGDILTVGPWYHIALTRRGNIFTLWGNGVARDTYTTSDALLAPNYYGYGQFWLDDASAGTWIYDGLFDECDVWKGISWADAAAETAFVEALADEAYYIG